MNPQPFESLNAVCSSQTTGDRRPALSVSHLRFSVPRPRSPVRLVQGTSARPDSQQANRLPSLRLREASAINQAQLTCALGRSRSLNDQVPGGGALDETSADSRLRIGVCPFSASVACAALDPPSAELRQLVVLGNGFAVTNWHHGESTFGLRTPRKIKEPTGEDLSDLAAPPNSCIRGA